MQAAISPPVLDAPAPAKARAPAIVVKGLGTRFGDHVVHVDLSFEVQRGEIFAIIGGSGSGKSTLLRELILLHRPDAGSVAVLGIDLLQADAAQALALRQRCGVMFQHGGLFASLNIRENIGLPLREHTQLPDAVVDGLAMAKLAMSGLPALAAEQLPTELSGGMLKRASLARALALDPTLLFLDEPTAGLDPISAAGVDELVLALRGQFGLTIVMITHDLDTLWRVADRVAVLADGRVQGLGAMAELALSDNPAVRAFFDGPRARSAALQSQQEPSSKPK